MRKITLLISLILFTCLTAFPQFKIGFVNTQKILTGTKIGIKLSKKVEIKQKEERDKLMSFQDAVNRIEKELKSPSLKASQKESKSRELFNAKRELKSRYDESSANFQKFTQAELAEMEKKIFPVINRIGKEKGYTAIYDIQRSGTIYFDNSVDITDEVIEAINREFPE